ncbi:alanine racemase [Stappia sp. ES.058]|uniref:alanine racemase n=1 Tax=Stappia sp. ES.058 TaxID=1881061 RepID=UPI00087AA60C|nr:alanine racemase [Stappia sp. ES.058]SDU13480.1 alanine racemase [Stappia sp. ES.058]
MRTGLTDHSAPAPDDAMHGAGDPGEGGRITIDLDALAANWQALNARLTGDGECGAAVKADCYGLGSDQGLATLWTAGCRTFFVATPQEGRATRERLPDATIHILNGLYPGAAEFYVAHGLRPVLGSMEEVAEWRGFIAGRSDPPPAGLHVDTGISRLGLSLHQARTIAAEPTSGFSPGLVMSHMACADRPDHPMNKVQLDRFQEATALFPGARRSLANSAAIFLGSDYHFDLARPGITLYGASASELPQARLRPVVTLESRILQVHELKRGETIGYGATFTAPTDMRVAMVSAGYADGYLRASGSTDEKRGADAWLAGYRLPILGRVSMDMSGFDVSAVPPDVAQRGAFVELFGANIPIDETAGCAGTIGYELLTGLGRRFSRRYLPVLTARGES